MTRTVSRLITLTVLAWLAGGCQTVQYYHQAISGEYQILSRRKPVADLLADPAVTPNLKQKFELILQLRAFAAKELKLPINQHYLTYVNLNRRFAVWNVHAAPEFSLQPKRWWYPFVGSLKYRGYFSEKDARNYGEQMARKGDDVYVEGVEAYSTLGWFADPLLNTFIDHPESDLAETIFHELGHQRLFLSGDTDFNEAFATTVAEEGVRRWYLAKQDTVGYQQYLLDLQRNRQFVEIIMHTRDLLQALYGDTSKPGVRPVPGPALSGTWMKDEKALLFRQLLDNYARLKESWGGDPAYDGWFAKPLNNAQLNTIAVYYELVPGFRALLRTEGNDLEHFYKAVSRLDKLTKLERHARLLRLGQSSER